MVSLMIKNKYGYLTLKSPSYKTTMVIPSRDLYQCDGLLGLKLSDSDMLELRYVNQNLPLYHMFLHMKEWCDLMASDDFFKNEKRI